MGVLIGDSAVTSFSYFEYQALMICLAGMICMGFLAIELTLNRMQVLPLLFPGMFCIRERRFYFFDLPVEDVAIGRKLHAEAKMLIRMTLCVVLSYLWQHCVLETEQIVGTQFPHQQCAEQRDCFASELHYLTLVTRQHTPVNCAGPGDDFPNTVVISCIRFVKPETTTWLMHLAISHSVTQLNLKSYEILTWIAGNHPRVRKLTFGIMWVSLAIWIVLFFSGIMSEFVSSWLSFVMSLSIPIFSLTVWRSAQVLVRLQEEVSSRVHERLENHLQAALESFELTLPSSEHERQPDDAEEPSPKSGDSSGDASGWSSSIAMRARSASSYLTRVLPRRAQASGHDHEPMQPLESVAEGSADELDYAQAQMPPLPP